VFDDGEWLQKLGLAINDINDAGQGQVYKASGDPGEPIDALFIAYQAYFHSQLDKNLLLQNHMGQIAQKIETATLLCCGDGTTDPDVSEGEVVDLANNQMTGLVGTNIRAHRVTDPTDLQLIFSTRIIESFRGRTMFSTAPADSPDGISVASSDVTYMPPMTAEYL
jgi:hypothetical protein